MSEPTITDEELAEIQERNAPPNNDDSSYVLRTMLQLSRRDNRRLIAALRAERAENERLRGEARRREDARRQRQQEEADRFTRRGLGSKFDA